jgi:hypothetical protein
VSTRGIEVAEPEYHRTSYTRHESACIQSLINSDTDTPQFNTGLATYPLLSKYMHGKPFNFANAYVYKPHRFLPHLVSFTKSLTCTAFPPHESIMVLNQSVTVNYTWCERFVRVSSARGMLRMKDVLTQVIRSFSLLHFLVYYTQATT